MTGGRLGAVATKAVAAALVSSLLLFGAVAVASSASAPSPVVSCDSVAPEVCDATWRAFAAKAVDQEPALADLEVLTVEIVEGLCGMEGLIVWSEGRAVRIEVFC